MLDSVEAILVSRDLPPEMSLLWDLVFSDKLELVRAFLPGIMGKSNWGLLCVPWLLHESHKKPRQGLGFPVGLTGMDSERGLVPRVQGERKSRHL